ncbi:hypothetical protein L210DRAFT_3546968 [Boletus edulis BED1]|uniref:Uncharacterized protein n=1 Tax=Boletus edulis BED1 TaxID=1328754 RepID=A0AAD4GCZ6_BOLED|nr:hypothetical protein L210DRAFT_3546968 [Boletus edulis BED1]
MKCASSSKHVNQMRILEEYLQLLGLHPRTISDIVFQSYRRRKGQTGEQRQNSEETCRP